MLLRFSKTNVLDDTSSATEDEARRNIVKLMSHEADNEEIKEKTLIKVNQAFDRIKNGSFSNQDRKVISCIVKKELTDESEYDVDSSEEINHNEINIQLNPGVKAENFQKKKHINQNLKEPIKSASKRFDKNKKKKKYLEKESSEASNE